MAAKKKKASPMKREFAEKVPFDTIVWVLDNLNPMELAAHDEAKKDAFEILGKANEMIEDGFQFSWKYDTYSASRMVSAMCLFIGFENTGLAISARGEDVVDCMSILLYKYYNVADRDLRGFADKIPTGIRG